MFNVLLSLQALLLLSAFAFFTFFAIRRLLISRISLICLYHLCLFFILFIASIGGGGVQNDGYQRLEKFISLEKSNRLEDAKKNPSHYDSTLKIDLKAFNNSAEFRDHLKKYDTFLDRAEAIFIGWIFALLAEISMAFAECLRYSLLPKPMRR